MEKLILRKQKTGHKQVCGQMIYYFVAVFAAAVSVVWWIANLGVVPLFLFPAFLLAPAFFAFLNLLFVVTHVLETIGKLLYSRDYYHRRINTNICILLKKSNFKLSFLPRFSRCVKGFFGILLLNLGIYGSQIHAEDYILSRGQSMTLKLPGMQKFNVANKEVLSYQLNESNKTLLIRGTSLGASEILVWNKGEAEPVEHQVFVISKIQEAKFLHLAQVLGELGLATKVRLPNLQVSGEITTLKAYLQYKKIQSQNSEIILDEAILKNELKRDVLAEVYQLFFNDYKDSLKCEINYSELTCLYPANEAPSEGLKKHLSDKYRVVFIEHNNQKLKNNYQVRLKLIQLEQMDGEELRLGLDQLSTSIGELISTPLNKIIEKNLVLLSQKKVEMSTLAEPVGLIRPGTPAEFQIGASVPYTTTSKEGVTNTQWQFAGLSVKVTMENMGEKIKITYETELTKPSTESNGAISGNKEKSSVVIDLSAPTQLFQISLKTDAQGVDQIPFLNRIPLLGELFKSKSSQNNYKMITGIIEVKNHD